MPDLRSSPNPGERKTNPAVWLSLAKVALELALTVTAIIRGCESARLQSPTYAPSDCRGPMTSREV
jgi:hypothetical protein